MKDPLDMQSPEERELFNAISRLVVGRPLHVVWGVGCDLIVNAIRQSTAQRKDAESRINELFNHIKTVTLDLHYDSVTGLRRGVIPHTQVIQMPFHDEGNVIFHGK